jgi:flagellar L-ring protein precursor FlgH
VRILRVSPFAAALLCAAAVLSQAAPASTKSKLKKNETPAQLRSDYIARLEEVDVPASAHTLGSLWSPGGDLNDLSIDYKARHLNDTLVIVASVQTTAAQSGDVNTSRAAAVNSAITGLAGDLKTKGVNPLFAANSSTALKGTGATDSNTTFQTSLTAQVIAVLPSGNLVVEAERKIFLNNQHEDILIRGVVRPDDIGPNNTVPSAALGNLEIEMKGKGIISEATRRLNPIARAIMWLVGL